MMHRAGAAPSPGRAMPEGHRIRRRVLSSTVRAELPLAAPTTSVLGRAAPEPPMPSRHTFASPRIVVARSPQSSSGLPVLAPLIPGLRIDHADHLRQKRISTALNNPAATVPVVGHGQREWGSAATPSIPAAPTTAPVVGHGQREQGSTATPTVPAAARGKLERELVMPAFILAVRHGQWEQGSAAIPSILVVVREQQVHPTRPSIPIESA